MADDLVCPKEHIIRTVTKEFLVDATTFEIQCDGKPIATTSFNSRTFDQSKLNEWTRTISAEHNLEWAREQLKIPYKRESLVEILVYHYQAKSSSCGCGWAELGKSWPEHIANVYEESATNIIKGA